MTVKRYEREGVQGFIHEPGGPAEAAIVLAHGAGSNANAPLLVALCEAFAGSGTLALRINLPFRQKRASGPPHPSMAAFDRDGLRHAAAALRADGMSRILLGGHSYGGRQVTMLAAEEPTLAERLLILSYPLHPPGRPDALRTAHFPDLRTPALFVHGDRDPFATIPELRKALQDIPAPWKLLEIGVAGHDLGRKGGEPKLAQRVLREFLSDG
ncbi:MAG: alpha/beta family hydrolase [Bryobacteraceae bacterium]|nr:alpha/beta family hydrolase [Bryobacteraceae bacterium]